jgi:hypothetical protein
MAIDDDQFKILDGQYPESPLDRRRLSSTAMTVAAAHPTPALAIAAASWIAFDRLSPSKVAERARKFQKLVRDELQQISR